MGRELPVIPKITWRDFIKGYFSILAVFIFFLIIIMLFSASMITDQIDTNDWVETPATVEFAEEREETTCDADGNCTTSYWTHVEYIYEYDGDSYSGNRYSFLSRMPSGLSDEFPTGKEITVYVDDNNPFESIMHKGWDGMLLEAVKILWIFIFLTGASIVIISIWQILFKIQSKQNKQKAIDNKQEAMENKENRGSFPYNMMLWFSILAFNRAPRIWLVFGSAIFLTVSFIDVNFIFKVVCGSTCLILPLLAVLTAKSFEKTLPEHSHKRYKLIYDAANGGGQGGWDSDPEAKELQIMARSAWIKKNSASLNMDDTLLLSQIFDAEAQKFEEGCRTFSVLIDGTQEMEFEARSTFELLEKISNFDGENEILYLEDTKEKGRKLEFSFIGDKGGDDHISIKELIGDEVIRDEIVNVERNPTEMIDIIEQALRKCETDYEVWWK